MAKFTFEIDDKFMAGIQDGVCRIFSYDPASGITKEQFFRDKTVAIWQAWYVQNKKVVAAEVAEKAALIETADLKDKVEKP